MNWLFIQLNSDINQTAHNAVGGVSASAPQFGQSPGSTANSAAGFSFPSGQQTTTGFSFGSAPAASQPSATGLFSSSAAPSFGVSGSSGGSFSFGGASSSALQPPSSAPTFSFGTTTAATTGTASSSSSPAPFTFPSTTAQVSSGGATQTGFSFSAATSAPAASTGLSFGTTSTTILPGSAASSSAGFSFSSQSTAAASAPPASFGESKPAVFGTASLPSFSPATSAPASSSAPSSTLVTASAPPKASIEAPSAIQGQQIDDIINQWTQELEKRSHSFIKHAEALAEWDKAILRNRHSLLVLEEDLRRVLAGQDALERRLQLLETHQKGIHEAISGMEAEAERLYLEEKPLADDEAAERDALYERAERVTFLMSRLGDQLTEAIEDVNKATSASLGDGNTPLGKLVRILNNQLDALVQLEDQTEELSVKLATLQQTTSQQRVNNGL